jgi:diguanylate cyclase (GGDEF)-like protein
MCAVTAGLLLLLLFWLWLHKNNFDKHLQRFIEYNNAVTVVTDTTEILMINKAGLNLFGFESVEALKKKTKFLSRLFQEIINDDTKYVTSINWVTKIPKRQHVIVEIQTGNFKQTYTMYVNKIKEDRYMVTFHNISHVVAEKKAISQEAHIDTLTHIYNRTKFDQMLSAAIRDAEIHDGVFSLILFDIDHFKKVNDTYGHDIGDKVLIQVSSLVKNMLHGYDTFARWGGEEFVILAESTTENEAHMLANRLRETIEHFPFEFVKQLTCSFGVSQYVKGDDTESLFKRTDEALYQAKKSGRNTVCIASHKIPLQ